MEQSCYSEANSSWASQVNASFLWNPEVHYRKHNSPQRVSFLIQVNTVHTPPFLYLMFHLFLELPSGLFPSGFPNKPMYAKYMKREDQQDATIRCLLLTSILTCFGDLYAHLQEIKGPVTAFGVLFWFCWMLLVAVVGRCDHNEGFCSVEQNCCILLVFSLHILLTMHGHRNLKILLQLCLTLNWNTCSKSALSIHGKVGIVVLQRRTTCHLTMTLTL